MGAAPHSAGLKAQPVAGYVDRYLDGGIIDPMITHNLQLDQINEAFELMHVDEHSLGDPFGGFKHHPLEDP